MEGIHPNSPNENNIDTFLWKKKLIGSGYDIISIVAHGEYVYAGTSYGEVHRYSLKGEPCGINILQAAPSKGEVRLTIYKDQLVVGTVGCIILIQLDNFEKIDYYNMIELSFPKTVFKNRAVSVIADDNFIYAGSVGYVFKYNIASKETMMRTFLNRGHQEVCLEMIGNQLIAGTEGHVVLIEKNDFERKKKIISLPHSGYETVSLLVYENIIYAGSNGYAYKISADGKEVKKNELEVVEKSEVSLAIKNDKLIAGSNGDIMAISLIDFEYKGEYITSLPHCKGEIVSVAVSDSYVYAGSVGYIYRIEDRKPVYIEGMGTNAIRFCENNMQLFAAGSNFLASIAYKES
ncbi:hypothetical protein [Kordia sp.]|uniref:hypothetical protein n=1 Tax=Kordia sp. TaxID=1965332 RepID=UPI003D6AA36B